MNLRNPDILVSNGGTGGDDVKKLEAQGYEKFAYDSKA
jgi:hypothetical protein